MTAVLLVCELDVNGVVADLQARFSRIRSASAAAAAAASTDVSADKCMQHCTLQPYDTTRDAIFTCAQEQT